MPGAAEAYEPRKLAGAIAVAALHFLLIAMLLRATQWQSEPVAGAKEIVMRLIPLPEPQPQHNSTKERKMAPVTPQAPATSFGDSFTPPAVLPGMPPPGLNEELFGCLPGQLAAATAEQRTRCASASLGARYDPGATDYHDHTGRSKNAVQWARDRARKNAPPLLPCMSPAGFAPLYTAYCLAKSALTGKLDTEDQPGYQDMPSHVANEGDTRMAPTPH